MDPQVPITTAHQANLIIIPVIFNTLAAVAVCLRLLARRVSNRNLEASDYIILVALVVTTALSALIAAEPFTGAGMHMPEVVAKYGLAAITTYSKVCCETGLIRSYTRDVAFS